MPNSASIEFLGVECAIRQLHARYADAVWRQDADAFADCFCEDAVWRIAGTELVGRAAIAAGFAGFVGAIERVLMTFRTPLVTLGELPGTASARTYVSEQNKLRDGSAVMNIGVYHERFVDEGERWRFAWRHWEMIYHGPADLSAPIHPGADHGPPPGMPGEDAETVSSAWWKT
jgi:ketosteroid isomerase-like protein